MKWFLFALLLDPQTGSEDNVYFLTNPIFESVESCVEYAQLNNIVLVDELMTQFPQYVPGDMYCIDEEKLEEMFGEMQSFNTEKSI